MLEYADIKKRRHKFYWILTFGFAYFILKGLWNLSVLIYNHVFYFITFVFNKLANTWKTVGK
tara:strand:+ start:331 stop:516 length:186 start_codon:yes stop_codon:yes gene_type:complete